MAKNANNGETNETNTATAQEANAVEAKTDSRSVILNLQDGSTVKRKDYILRRWGEGASRGEIAKELTELQGKNVPYQIVFQATKDVPGGPAPKSEGGETTAAE